MWRLRTGRTEERERDLAAVGAPLVTQLKGRARVVRGRDRESSGAWPIQRCTHVAQAHMRISYHRRPVKGCRYLSGRPHG